jgi:uncharacterized membrane protein
MFKFNKLVTLAFICSFVYSAYICVDEYEKGNFNMYQNHELSLNYNQVLLCMIFGTFAFGILIIAKVMPYWIGSFFLYNILKK